MRTLFVRLLACFTLLSALLPAAYAQETALGVPELSPTAFSAGEEPAQANLYLGPTQGSYRPEALTVDLAGTMVYFGQFDCWAMVASGTPEDMGPIGWVEAAAAAFPEEPQLSFDDALPVMVEDDTFLTAQPLDDSPEQLRSVAHGEQVLLLATLADWGYVQSEIDGAPVRAFLPLSAIL